MSSKKSSARARVLVTLEIELTQGWGDDCTTAQIYKQASEEAIDVVMGPLAIDGSTRTIGAPHPAIIVGKPKVTVVLLEEK